MLHFGGKKIIMLRCTCKNSSDGDDSMNDKEKKEIRDNKSRSNMPADFGCPKELYDT